jgi:hypothetical protein
MLPFIVYYYPETKGLSLEEIGALFGDEVALDISHLSERERAELDERLERTVDITNSRRRALAVILEMFGVELQRACRTNARNSE